MLDIVGYSNYYFYAFFFPINCGKVPESTAKEKKSTAILFLKTVWPIGIRLDLKS